MIIWTTWTTGLFVSGFRLKQHILCCHSSLTFVHQRFRIADSGADPKIRLSRCTWYALICSFLLTAAAESHGLRLFSGLLTDALVCWQNYRFLDLLNVLCVCNGVAIANNQTYIAEHWLRRDTVSCRFVCLSVCLSVTVCAALYVDDTFNQSDDDDDLLYRSGCVFWRSEDRTWTVSLTSSTCRWTTASSGIHCMSSSMYALSLSLTHT